MRRLEKIDLVNELLSALFIPSNSNLSLKEIQEIYNAASRIRDQINQS